MDTDTDFFAAKWTRTDPTEFRRKKVRVHVRVRVRVVEFSYNSLSHSRLACSRLSAHIQPSANNPDTNGAAKLLNTTRQYNYNGHDLS